MVSLVSFWRAVVREFGGARGRGSAWMRLQDERGRTFGKIVGEIAAELAVVNAGDRAVVNGNLCTVRVCAVVGDARERCRRWRRATRRLAFHDVGGTMLRLHSKVANIHNKWSKYTQSVLLSDCPALVDWSEEPILVHRRLF